MKFTSREMQTSKQAQSFHSSLKEKTDQFAFLAYRVSKSFPQEELYGLTSQLRRAALSVPLNYIEGFARVGSKTHKNFLQIAYGSLKEACYILSFAQRERYIKNNKDEYEVLIKLGDEIGAMLWTTIKGLETKE